MVSRSPKVDLIAFGLLCWFLSSCATIEPEIVLNPGAEKVRIFMSEQKDCKFLAEVTGFYTATYDYEPTDEKARILLKNEVLAKSGNAVVIISQDRQNVDKSPENPRPGYTKIFGNAYKCRDVDNIK